MTTIVTQYDRKHAEESQLMVIRHLLDRSWDLVREAGETSHPDELILAGNRLASLAATVQKTAYVYKGLVADRKQHESKPEADTPAEVPVPAPAVPEESPNSIF